ncbi:MAG: M6 family metalloprotease domain-containing protein [Candidatus Latescibacteria bacterium]|nr:M6 family metalloprotease domain-containing protein [Candidatus Latescibacterota bacterium]
MFLCIVLIGIILGGSQQALAVSGGPFVCAGLGPVNKRSGAAKLMDDASPVLASQGQVQALVVFAAFADEPLATDAVPAFAADLFAPEKPGSLSHFYGTMSFDQFNLQGTVLRRRYRSQQPASAYLAEEPGKEGQYNRFVREVLRQVDRDVDLGLFDNDGPDGVPNSGDDDGVVDYLFVNVHSVPAGFLLDGATGIAGLESFQVGATGASGEPLKLGGGRNRGAIQQEGDWAQTVGVMAHEFGHSLGLPDLYDLIYNGPEDDSAGIGAWGLMGWGALGWNGADGPNPFCAWSREQLGWVGTGNERLVEIEGDVEGLAVGPLDAGGHVYRIAMPPRNLENFTIAREYFLLEQRVRSASYYDRHLPGEGLLVWHIRPQYGNNNDERGKIVDLICADGLFADAGYPGGEIVAPQYGGDNLDFWAHDQVYAAARSGNLGDATDPFGGADATRFERTSNPSSNPQNLLPAELTDGLSLRRMQRRGMATRLDIALPRWAGVVERTVHWAGDILVDGDVRIVPEGRLYIHPGTRVRFAQGDRLTGGEDPGRGELVVQGSLVVLADETGPPVVFEPLQADGDWYGIGLDPAAGQRVVLPVGGYQLRAAVRGIWMPQAPSAEEGKLVRRHRLIDGAVATTAGNSDGRLNPGESFLVEVEVANWTLDSYEHLQAELRWAVGSVGPTFVEPTGRRIRTGPVGLYPGTQQVLRLPSLTLSRAVAAGTQIEFSLLLKNGGEILWRDDLVYGVEGSAPEFATQFAVPGYALRQQSALVPHGRPVEVQALVGGAVATAALVVHRVTDGELVAQLPMGRVGAADGATFAADFQPPDRGLYRARLRLAGTDNRAVFEEEDLYLWAALEDGRAPLLVFIGLHHPGREREEIHQVFAAAAARLGYGLHILERAPEEGQMYQRLLGHYVKPGGLVVWLGEFLDRAGQEAMTGFLARGGRLGLISYSLGASGGVGNSFKREVLHVVKSSWSKTRQLSPLYIDESDYYLRAHLALETDGQVEPVLVNNRQQVAGIRLAQDDSRLVYLPFNLNGLVGHIRDRILESTLDYLADSGPRVQWKVAGQPAVGDGLEVQQGRPVPVRVEVEEGVVGVDLVVRSRSQVALLGEVPMERIGSRVFEVDLEPPDSTQFHLSLRLQQQDGRRVFVLDGIAIEARPPNTVVADDQGTEPLLFGLQPNWPNPFNGRTAISYQVVKSGLVELAIYNTAGQLLRRLVAREQTAGRYQIWWDGRDEVGRSVASGVYLYRLQAGDHGQARRLLLLR